MNNEYLGFRFFYSQFFFFYEIFDLLSKIETKARNIFLVLHQNKKKMVELMRSNGCGRHRDLKLKSTRNARDKTKKENDFLSEYQGLRAKSHKGNKSML